MNGRDCDVVVVGCGPVGATAAILLANAGLSVVIADKEDDLYPLPRAVAVDDDALRVWETVPGLVAKLSDGMITGALVRYTGIGRRTFMAGDSSLHTTVSGHPMMALFHQPTLERGLRDQIGSMDRIDLRTGTECTDFSQDEEGVSVTLHGDSGKDLIRADWLLACDGAGSGIRSRMGVGFSGNTFVQKWVVADVFTDDPGTERPEVEFACDPARPAVTMPMPGGRRRWEFMLMPGDDEQAIVTPERLGELINSSGWTADYQVERAVVYTFHARVADRWREGRIFLLGDAAHVTPPFIGQGMNSGIRDAGNLWWKIAAVESGTAEGSLLDTYEIERRSHVKEMIDLAVRLGGIIQTVNVRVARLRDLVLGALTAMPGIAKWTGELRWKPSSVIERGFLAGQRRRRRSLMGTQIPRPMMARINAEPARLDEMIGARWAVVSTRANPLDALSPASRQLADQMQATVISTIGPDAAVDRTGVLDAFLGRAGGTVLVRPDRFVYDVARA